MKSFFSLMLHQDSRSWLLLRIFSIIAALMIPKKIDPKVKLQQLRTDLARYEEKLGKKMKTYRGVIHESASSELKHSEVMVLTALVADLKREIQMLEQAYTL
jgi:hypothetical protein